MPDPAKPTERTLPSLREDIRLLPTRPDAQGRPQWTLFDPIAHQYFLVDAHAAAIVTDWPTAQNTRHLAELATARLGREVTSATIDELLRFLVGHQLVDLPQMGWRSVAERAERKGGIVSGLLHSYLFFKVPLVRPEAGLRATLILARMLVSRTALVILAIIASGGLYFASRRWDQFIHTFNDFWTAQGAAIFGIVLLVLKLLHELGHAYVATAKGCRVQSMGVIFMLGAPMPYTDVTDAWRLTNRRDRIAIDLAGIGVELAVAILATFAWVFLPDGIPRTTAFVLATSAWIMSLAVNLNPLMRFDGYFVLADLVNIPNLQPRSFAMAKWALRRLLFGLDAPPPEVFSATTRRLLVAYGVAVWLYRLVLFTGIALIVYHMVFKALGIMLFMTEIIVLIALPIWREVKVWWASRKAIVKATRGLVTAGALGLLVMGSFLPLSTSVGVPAILEPAAYSRIYPTIGGQVAEVHLLPGERVTKGALLVTLDSAPLQHDLQQTLRRLALIETRLDRRTADFKDLAATPQLEQERESLLAKLAAQNLEREQLLIRAPLNGRVAEISPLLHRGRFISRNEDVALITDDSALTTRGYARLDEMWRLKPGSSGVFVPESGNGRAIDVRLRHSETASARRLHIPALASIFGGSIETWPATKSGDLVPVHASHLIEFEPLVAQTLAEALPITMQRGTVKVEALPESFAARAWRQILRVLVQESGF